MIDDFAIFILTHGRPDKQLTLDMLNRLGYTGKVYLVLDDQDSTIQQYIDNYGSDMIYVFDKNYYVLNTDTGNSNPVFGCGVYARNAIEDIATELGLSVYAQADDDIINLRIRYPLEEKVATCCINMLDNVLYLYAELIKNTPFAYIGFGNQPAYFGGKRIFETIEEINYPYAFMIRNTKVPVKWMMNFSDDYVTPAMLSMRGNLCLQIPYVKIEESPTITNDGGMADSYKNETDLSLAFYIKMCNPNLVSIDMTESGIKVRRHGRQIRPKIISGGFKK